MDMIKLNSSWLVGLEWKDGRSHEQEDHDRRSKIQVLDQQFLVHEKAQTRQDSNAPTHTLTARSEEERNERRKGSGSQEPRCFPPR